MQYEQEYRERCSARGLDSQAIGVAVQAVRSLEEHARGKGFSMPGLPLALVEDYLAGLLRAGGVVDDTLVALARYFTVARADAIAIRLLAYLLPIGVLDSMSERLGSLAGAEARERVMRHVDIPPRGAPPDSYPDATKAFVEALVAELGDQRARRVLAWNVHGIPPESFAAERAHYLELGSVDAWLAEWHDRQVAILQKHADDGTLWFEQKISQPVVDFVRNNPEIQGGVRVGDTIFVTKIPYNPDRFLVSTDPLEKRQLACHCPLASGAITQDGSGVPPTWCACSAGFTKFPFDVVFGVDTEATVIKSVLAGDDLCRFAIHIPALS
ncbi:MAG TPA: hypothetical protein VMX33_00695 [bacterium]|nr:hypothetical protein [bacterium]